MYETIDVTVDAAGVATLMLNRPRALNAFNREMLREFVSALDALEEREDARVVVLRGSGRAFCAGMDLRWSEEMTPKDRVEQNRLGQKALGVIERMGTPVIAAVHGYALGGGLEVALAADFIVCADDARLGLPEITLSARPPYRPKITEDGDPDQPEYGGVVAGWGAPRRLPERVGKAVAKELMLTGEHIDATRALEIGLVNHVYPRDEFDERVHALADRIAAMNPYNVRLTKELLDRGYDVLEPHPR
jgi:enoyl-CoA hydratase